MAALAVAALCFAAGWQVSSWKDRADDAKKAEATLQAIADANYLAAQADMRLQKELAKPRAGVKIREVVRNNPSDCVVPEPVAAGLREAVRSANAATR